MRAALYARFSSDLQSAASIPDQLHAARALAERLGAVVVGEFEDAAISGTSMVNRPGLNALLAACAEGRVDVVIAEALDRLTRGGGDAWTIFEDLRDLGVRIHTASEGWVEEMAVGLKGTMNALYIREIGAKTRRGQAGVARSGRRAAGAPPYGYRLLKVYDAAGEPIRGVMEIDPDKALVVARIAAEFAAGKSPRAIASDLNAEGVPGPGVRGWSRTHINGDPVRGTGILHNALYRGDLVHGRCTFTKNRRTARRRARPADPATVTRVAAPDLAIGAPALWAAVDARLDTLRTLQAATGRTGAARRPQTLLSGLVRCGSCGGAMILAGAGQRLMCRRRRDSGETACANPRTMKISDVEVRCMDAVRDLLLRADVIEAVVREYHAERRRLAAETRGERAGLDRDLAETQARLDRLVDQVANGVLAGDTVAGRIRDLEAQAAGLRDRIASAGDPDAVVTVFPGLTDRWRREVDALQDALARDETLATTQAREAFRDLVKSVQIHPQPGRGNWTLTLTGDLAPFLNATTDPNLMISTAERTFGRRYPNFQIPIQLSA